MRSDFSSLNLLTLRAVVKDSDATVPEAKLAKACQNVSCHIYIRRKTAKRSWWHSWYL
jgi:hypothetical protein